MFGKSSWHSPFVKFSGVELVHQQEEDMQSSHVHSSDIFEDLRFVIFMVPVIMWSECIEMPVSICACWSKPFTTKFLYRFLINLGGAYIEERGGSSSRFLQKIKIFQGKEGFQPPEHYTTPDDMRNVIK